jgi:nucleoside phosphorylase
MVQSEMGSGGQGGSILTIQEAIDALHPAAIVMVGIAFGIDQSKYQIGDILVSQQIVGYEPQRVGTGPQNEPTIIPRGDRSSASPRMLSRFRAAAHYWQAPPKVEFGLLLSGDKLVDNQDFRNQLLSLEPEAIGGEMEGVGLYAVAQRKKVDWIVVKAICDWADGNKHQDKRQRQQLAAENAARFTVYVLKQGGFEQTEQETAETPFSDATNNDKPKPKSAEQHLADLKRRVELDQKRASEQGQQGNNDHTIQEISTYTINTIRKSLM